jgi:hypothetical protein
MEDHFAFLLMDHGGLGFTNLKGRCGNGSNTHGYEFECHSLPYFSLNSDMNANIFGYEYKTDSRIRILIRIFTQFNSNNIP